MNDGFRGETGPYTVLPHWILFSDVSHLAVKVWCVLSKLSNDLDKTCYPSHEYIAQKAGMCERSVRSAIVELVELGALTVTSTHGAAGSNVYTVRSTDPRQNMSDEGGGSAKYVSTPRYILPTSDSLQKESLLKDSLPTVENHTQGKKTAPRRPQQMGMINAPTLEQCKEYAKQINLPMREAEKFFNRNTSIGWKVGRGNTPMKDFESAMRYWKSNAKSFAAARTAPTNGKPPPYDDEKFNRDLDEIEAGTRKPW